MIRIKDDFIDEQLITGASFNDDEKEFIIHLKNGGMFIYGPHQRVGTIPKMRIITESEYAKAKDYFAIDQKAKTII